MFSICGLSSSDKQDSQLNIQNSEDTVLICSVKATDYILEEREKHVPKPNE